MELYIFYKLVCLIFGIDEIYVGQTVNVKDRIYTHKYDSKTSNTRVNKYIREHGWENFEMIFLEEKECENRAEAEIIEGYWAKKLEASLNMKVPGRTKEEYREDNRDRIRLRDQKYHEDNRKKYQEYDRKYHENNRESIQLRGQKYRENNSEIINAKHTCECGGRYTYSNKTKHEKTKKHIEFTTTT